MNGPLVSAAIVVRDGERFLADAIESLLGQTYQPLQAIVVDDGSRDSSPAIAAAYPVRLVVQEPLGLAAARNAAVDAAGGEFVAFLDADDLWHAEKIERQVAFLRARPAWSCPFGTVRATWSRRSQACSRRRARPTR